MSLSAETAPQRGGNLIALGLIQAFRMLSGLAINVMVMHGLGVEGFGIYGYVISLVGLASFGSSMGMDRLLKREISRDEGRAGHYVATGLAASLLLSVITALLIVLWVAVMDGRPQVVVAAGLASVALGLQTLAVVPVSAFHAIQRMGLGVQGNAWGRLVLVLATATFLALHFEVISVFAAQVMDASLTLGLVWVVYRRHLGQQPLTTSWPDVKALIKESIPFGLNSLFVIIYLGSDVLLLSHLRGDTEVGIYRAAVMLLSLFPMIADTLSTGMYPRMARYLGQAELAGQELRFSMRILLAISIPAAVGGVLTAKPLMIFIGGPAFADSALLFAIMVPLLPLRFLNNNFGMALSALNHQNARTQGAILAAVFNVGLNLILIPHYGALGAAITTLLTEILLILFMFWRVRPLVSGLGLGNNLLRIGFPASIMAAVLWVLPPMHVVFSIAIGIGVYGRIAYLSGAWHPRDLRQLRRV
jgi:O-antigen/teichoic acid export membrane protein